MIINMFNENLDLPKISKITGLSIKAIEKIIKEQERGEM